MKEIHLILDLYRAHNNDEIKEAAKPLGIILYFIPAEFTDRFQPDICNNTRHTVRQSIKEGKTLNKIDTCNWKLSII